MSSSPILNRLAVCSWSLQPSGPPELLEKLSASGVQRVQLALDPLRESPAAWDETEKLFAARGVGIVSGMMGCVGEDYSSLESIRVTGGLAPDSTWPHNKANIKGTAVLAHELKLKLVTFHAGFIPHEDTDPGYRKMLERLGWTAAQFAAYNIALGLETGQETAADLAKILDKLKLPNLGVNFDPANMILYDKGDPIQALRTLGPWIRQVHIKDAVRTTKPGTWGEEVPVGTGQVDWRAFFATLNELKFKGDFIIEREAGDQRVTDIQAARVVVEKAFA